MEFAITKLSTKGQVVIPQSMRTDLKPGDDFLLVKEKGSFVLKKMSDVSKYVQDDIKFSECIDRAWKQYDSGQFISMSEEEFDKELDEW